MDSKENELFKLAEQIEGEQNWSESDYISYYFCNLFTGCRPLSTYVQKQREKQRVTGNQVRILFFF